jgi:hypothetical protein
MTTTARAERKERRVVDQSEYQDTFAKNDSQGSGISENWLGRIQKFITETILLYSFLSEGYQRFDLSAMNFI